MTDAFFAQLREDYSPRRKYLIGVSGGRDSVMLLHALHQAGFKSLVVCHLNHALRGRASGQDAAFVKRLAQRLTYQYESQRVDVKASAKTNKVSIEVAARQARHDFFAKVAKAQKCRRLFLAHHADDQVETVLINLFRGSGLRGLAGMRASAMHTIEGVEVEFLRPLLELWRADIDEYLEQYEIVYREDASNESHFALRNRIRHRLLPEIEQVFERDVRGAVQRMAKMAGAENAALEAVIEASHPGLSAKNADLPVATLRSLPEALQARVIRQWLNNNGIPGTGFREVEAIRSLVPLGSQVAKINLPQKKCARRRQGRIFIDLA
ncbi:MAG: tRNA lysidine(34) synthetase TilS [Verrucomicrobiales bacterium]|nr:tRNA lysidine(34) synthetase TilS [Verrucomicrobiales bacterium]